MKKNFWLKSLVLAATVFGIVLLVGAQQNQSTKAPQSFVDTPRNKVKDIDEALRQLEKARVQLEQTLTDETWQKELNQSMKELEADKMKQRIEQAMSQADAAKMQAELQKAIKEIDFEKIKGDIQKAISEVDAAKIQSELTRALKEVDLAKIKTEIQSSLAEVDMKKMQEELKKIQPEIERSMNEARVSMDKATKELTAYKTLVNDLEKDGLLDKNNYTIEYKKGELFINGKKQPENIQKKYSNFLKGRKDFTITKEGDNFNINND